jgi:hypothetical protein
MAESSNRNKRRLIITEWMAKVKGSGKQMKERMLKLHFQGGLMPA